MSWDPCPASLQADRLASWKCTDRFSGSWLDTTATYSLTNNNTVQVRKASQGRTFVGPACYYDWSQNECWTTTESALLPSGDWSFCGVLWHDNASNFTSVEMRHILFATNLTGSLVAQFMVYQTTNYRRRLYFQTTGASSTSVYFDSIAAGEWDEPIVIGVCQDSGATEVKIYTYGLLSGDLIDTTTIGTLMGTSDTILIGRHLTGTISGFNSTRHIGDCYTIADAVWTAADVLAYRDHIVAQREVINTFLEGQAA